MLRALLLISLLSFNANAGLITNSENKAYTYISADAEWQSISFEVLIDGLTYSDIDTSSGWISNPNVGGTKYGGIDHNLAVWEYGWIEELFIRSYHGGIYTSTTLWDGESIRPFNPYYYNRKKRLDIYTPEPLALLLQYEDGDKQTSAYWVPDNVNEKTLRFGSSELILYSLSFTTDFTFVEKINPVDEPETVLLMLLSVSAVFLRIRNKIAKKQRV